MQTIDSKQICDCEELTQIMLSTMKADGYSCSGEVYIFRSLILFCRERYDGLYSSDAGIAFLTEKLKLFQSKDHKALYRNTISRLDQALSGNFHWKPDPVLKPYKSSCFDKVVHEYELYLNQTRKTKNDIRRHVRLAADVLAIAESQKALMIADITPDIVYTAFVETGSKESFRKIKPFFRYIYNRGLTSRDFSMYVPSVSRHNPIPSVYTQEEINTVLASVDRGSLTGKRDYCILLLAARYGIRTSDIAGLCFSNIDFSRRIIHIIQGKTGVPVDFPLTEEVLEALNDYIKNARPDSKQPNVFLSIPRPYAGPLSMQGIYAIVSKYFSRSGIDIQGRRHGAHALRSSLATQLLNEGAGYHEIQQVLGHTSPDVATHYIRVEVEKLRECSLSVPPPGKGLLSYLEGRAVKS